mmetsp:Transcript_19857/g.25049  ORF Transcript_19857/g.25049 Transcript_19857/m.25049 type:complete len:245 (-) Transcript_19857:344-1078(-)
MEYDRALYRVYEKTVEDLLYSRRTIANANANGNGNGNVSNSNIRTPRHSPRRRNANVNAAENNNNNNSDDANDISSILSASSFNYEQPTTQSNDPHGTNNGDHMSSNSSNNGNTSSNSNSNSNKDRDNASTSSANANSKNVNIHHVSLTWSKCSSRVLIYMDHELVLSTKINIKQLEKEGRQYQNPYFVHKWTVDDGFGNGGLLHMELLAAQNVTSVGSMLQLKNTVLMVNGERFDNLPERDWS